MPCLLVGYGWRKSMTFLCVNVNHGRLIRILHALENLDEFFDVVTLFQILVFKANTIAQHPVRQEQPP